MDKKEPEIDFPTDWSYKVICLQNADNVLTDIIAHAAKLGYPGIKPTAGNSSKGGKYITWNLTIPNIPDKESMSALGDGFGGLTGVKMVL